MSDPDLLSGPEEDNQRSYLHRIEHEELRRAGGQKYFQYFPTFGPFRRELYPRHMEFFAAGQFFSERLFMAANRVGKTDAGSYEATCHLTGIYPDWWVGRRFSAPIEMWACGTTSETTRDIVQAKLLGPHDQPIGGMIPSHLIINTQRRPHGLPGSIESAYVRHVSGGVSILGLKTYEQGRKSYEGTGKHVIWDDEEPPADVYQEQLLRTLTTHGLVYTTFTPLQGMSEVVTGFLEASAAAAEVKIYIQAGWDDVPHLDEGEKRRHLATMLPYQIPARTKGEPSLGAGAIYPLSEDDFVIPAAVYPHTWPKGYGMDVGWNRTAALFVAEQPTTGIYIAYDEHYLSAGEPPSHAMGIRARGEWLEGVIDPASRGRSQHDGVRLIDSYNGLGLKLTAADHAIDAGLQDCWTLLVTGRFKVTANCVNFLREFKKYHRDEKGNIVKVADHLMDAWRYWVRSGRDKMRAKPKDPRPGGEDPRSRGESWMAH